MMDQIGRLASTIPDRIWDHYILDDREIHRQEFNEFVVAETDVSDYERGKLAVFHHAVRLMTWMLILFVVGQATAYLPGSLALLGLGIVVIASLPVLAVSKLSPPEYRDLGNSDTGVDPLQALRAGGDD